MPFRALVTLGPYTRRRNRRQKCVLMPFRALVTLGQEFSLAKKLTEDLS